MYIYIEFYNEVSLQADNATYPLQFGSMTGSYYFAARINSDNEDFIDFKLSGQAKGWVAVGFSATREMVRQREERENEED